MRRRSFPKSLLKSWCETCDSTLALELDHWDSNPSNDDPSNAATLCHACHELKTLAVREEGAAYASETDNASFRKAIETAKKRLGANGFRERQDGQNQEWLDSKAAQTTSEHCVEVYECRCTNPGQAHEFSSRVENDSWPTTVSTVCPPCSTSPTQRAAFAPDNWSTWMAPKVPSDC